MLRIPVKTPSRGYEAVIERGVLGRAGQILASLLRDRDAYVITVPAVRRHWGKALVNSLKASGFAVKTIEMQEGERFKRLSTLEALADKMVKLGADRRAVVLAFGGGVVGDVAGLLASVYMRGVRLVQIPTTVQAQLDAAIGGKTGVNLRGGKNLLGTFYQPEIVLIDTETLCTLPDREFRAGMYEALKCGVIGNRELFERLSGSSLDDFRRDQEFLAWTIAASVSLKAGVVSADEREGNLRRVLNFGHTIGHALEAATDYRHFLHGEAVAWGMIAAARIAAEVGSCDRNTYQQVREATLAWGRLPRVSVTTFRVLKLIQSDKKTEKGTVNFVLPKEIGKVEVVKNIPAQAMVLAMDEIRRLSRD